MTFFSLLFARYSLQQEIVAISCSWCKAAYHNKNQCYTEQLLVEACDFGMYAQIVVPPTWIVKLPRKVCVSVQYM